MQKNDGGENTVFLKAKTEENNLSLRRKIFLQLARKISLAKEHLEPLRNQVLLCKIIQIFFQFGPLGKMLAHETLEMIIVITFFQMGKLMHHYILHTREWHAS